MKQMKIAMITCLSIMIILLSMLVVDASACHHFHCKITSFKRWPCKFSPNGDGIKDTTTIDATFSTSCNWKLQIKPICGCDFVVREWNDTGTSLTIVWDGKDKAGVVVPDGAYRINLTIHCVCVRAWGSDTEVRIVIVDTTPPTVTNVTVSPDPFNPLTEVTQINYTLSECAYVTIKIFSTKPWTLRRVLIKWEKQLWGFHSVSWDGKDDSGNNLPPGTYHMRIYVTDLAGNKATIYPVKITVRIV